MGEIVGNEDGENWGLSLLPMYLAYIERVVHLRSQFELRKRLSMGKKYREAVVSSLEEVRKEKVNKEEVD